MNYLALHRPDLQFAASGLGWTMARPTQHRWSNLKRVGKYLLSHPRVVFEYARAPERVPTDRRLLGLGLGRLQGLPKDHERRNDDPRMGVIKALSNRQASVAQSSGEAKCYSACKAAAEGVAMQALLNDLGWHAEIHIRIDASAARSMANRQGIGRVKHLQVRLLVGGSGQSRGGADRSG